MKGKVKWFSNAKGYGFICQEKGEEAFIHYDNIKQDGYRTLNEGQNVLFDLIVTDKGLQAVNVEEDTTI